MDNKIFRQKSIDRISSPEDLNSYMRVTNPPVWYAMAAVILILIGAVIWGVFGHIETRVKGVAVSNGTSVTCYISESDIKNVNDSMTIVIDGQEYEISRINTVPMTADTTLGEYARHLADFSDGEYVYAVITSAKMEKGNYSCYIVTESIPAISFLFNSSN